MKSIQLIHYDNLCVYSWSHNVMTGRKIRKYTSKCFDILCYKILLMKCGGAMTRWECPVRESWWETLLPVAVHRVAIEQQCCYTGWLPGWMCVSTLTLLQFNINIIIVTEWELDMWIHFVATVATQSCSYLSGILEPGADRRGMSWKRQGRHSPNKNAW